MDAITFSPTTGRIQRPRCRGTVEHHRRVALDVRELTRQGVFDRPAGLVFRPTMAYPWLRTIRLDAFSLVLQLATGHTVTVSWIWVRRGFFDTRIFLCPCCGRRVYALYHLNREVICRACGDLWYASQRCSANGRRCLKAQRLRFKLGGPAALKSFNGLDADTFPPRPPRMHRRTYERLKRREE